MLANAKHAKAIEEPRIEKKLDHTSEVYFHRGGDQGWKPYRRDILTATAADASDGDFFVVMTLQRGEAPSVEVDGDGLAATVTVGAFRSAALAQHTLP